MLPAPIIEGTLPAFSGGKIKIPFTMSRAVSAEGINGFSLKVKNLYNSAYLLSLVTEDIAWDNSAKTSGVAIFGFDSDKLSTGSFYKVQIAYYSKDKSVGYYSTIGVIKYTETPILTIEGVEDFNTTRLAYGIYSNEDATEKEYRYRFRLFNKGNKLIDDTGYQLHLIGEMEYDAYSYIQSLDGGEYYLLYSVETNNSLECETKSKAFNIMGTKLVSTKSLGTELNEENGYVLLKADSQDVILCRSEDEGKTWVDLSSNRDNTIEQGKEYIYGFYNKDDLSTRYVAAPLRGDFEHAFLSDGERQLKIKFNPKMSTFKTTVFESKVDTLGSKYPFFFRNGDVEYKEIGLQGLISYLSDEEGLFFKGNKNLFSTVERALVENFTDVDIYIHLKYEAKYGVLGEIQKQNYRKQIFFDNYNHLFIKQDGKFIKVIDTEGFNLRNPLASYIENEVYYLEHYRDDKEVRAAVTDFKATTQLSSENITQERQFKLEVLDWLNNGKPKLLRTPTEGNYIIRLMSVSLSPEEQLGRTLHSFSATGYEVQEYNPENAIAFLTKEA